jgi:hypothetical protein
MRARTVLLLIAALPLIGSCASPNQPGMPPATGTGMIPSSIPADQLVGDWGLASYHQEGARTRTETQARAQCRNPYKIGKGPHGGVIMHLADSKEPTELFLKGSTDGKNYIGPEGPPTQGDGEITSFNGNVMTLRWLDPDLAGRFGTMIYVRCGKKR